MNASTKIALATGTISLKHMRTWPINLEDKD